MNKQQAEQIAGSLMEAACWGSSEEEVKELENELVKALENELKRVAYGYCSIAHMAWTNPVARWIITHYGRALAVSVLREEANELLKSMVRIREYVAEMASAGNYLRAAQEKEKADMLSDVAKQLFSRAAAIEKGPARQGRPSLLNCSCCCAERKG